MLAQVVWRGALARVEAAAEHFDVALALAREGADMAALTDGLTMRAEALLDLAAVLDAAGETEDAAIARARGCSPLCGEGRRHAVGSRKP